MKYCVCANFQTKQTALTFLSQICLKMDLGLEIRKTNFGIRIKSLRYSVWQFLKKSGNFDFFGPNMPNNGFWGRNFENLCPDAESAPPRYYVNLFSGKTNNFDFFGPNMPENGFWGRNFENLTLNAESPPPKFHVCQFSGKMDN